MINKIIASYLLFCCLVAIALKLGGVEGTFHLGSYFRSYLITSNMELMDVKIEIPDIPQIPYVENIGSGEWYEFAVNALNGIIGFLNGVVTLLNFLIMVVNNIIQVLELLFIFLKNLITMKNNIVSA